MQALRKRLKQIRASLSPLECYQASEKIMAQLFQQIEWKNAQHIATYVPIGNEVFALDLMNSAADKNFYLPVIQENNSLLFSLYRPGDQLMNNRYTIPEPVNRHFFPVEKLDLVITPLLGFDVRCYRLGMGGGYYDRTFEFLNTYPRPAKPGLIGLAYEAQRLEDITPQSWDVQLNKVITEKKVYVCNTGS